MQPEQFHPSLRPHELTEADLLVMGFDSEEIDELIGLPVDAMWAAIEQRQAPSTDDSSATVEIDRHGTAWFLGVRLTTPEDIARTTFRPRPVEDPAVRQDSAQDGE